MFELPFTLTSKIIFFEYFACGLQLGIDCNVKMHLISENKEKKVDKAIQLIDIESVN